MENKYEILLIAKSTLWERIKLKKKNGKTKKNKRRGRKSGRQKRKKRRKKR